MYPVVFRQRIEVDILHRHPMAFVFTIHSTPTGPFPDILPIGGFVARSQITLLINQRLPGSHAPAWELIPG